LNGIPASYLEGLADDLHCELHSKKLTSREVFHLLLLGFFDTTPLSWHVLEEHYRGTLFQKQFSPSATSIDHRSVNERLEKYRFNFPNNYSGIAFPFWKNTIRPKIINVSTSSVSIPSL
jgi:hypothetical protein